MTKIDHAEFVAENFGVG